MSIDVEFTLRKDIRNNPVVREHDTRQKREFRRLLWLASVAVGLLLFSAWQHYEILSHGYAIESLQVDIATEEAVNRRLRLNLETLRAPQQIETRARRELGLSAPTDKDTIVIERSRSSSPGRSMVAMVH
jgi:cell division protein FtsB